jgi:hypothetical protein
VLKSYQNSGKHNSSVSFQSPGYYNVKIIWKWGVSVAMVDCQRDPRGYEYHRETVEEM